MTLKEVLRSGGIKHLVMAGVATSSVILSTFTLGADEDYSITILSEFSPMHVLIPWQVCTRS